MNQTIPLSTPTATASQIQMQSQLRGKKLSIPDLRPAFAAWKQGVNRFYEDIKQDVDARLERVLGGDVDARVLEKLRGADIGLFACGWFPDAPYQAVETAAYYCIWLFLWDDAIDGAEGREGGGLDAEEYCRQSAAYAEFWLGLVDASQMREPQALTAGCGSFAEVGRRIGRLCTLEQKREVFGHLREYMEGCVTECQWRVSGKVPSVEEFYGWRLRTSSVDVMLDLCRILNGITLPGEILESSELAAMGLCVNKLLILINELFSLKKELKDGAFGNLIPITMQASGSDLEGAVSGVVEDIYKCIRDFDSNAAVIRGHVTATQSPEVTNQLQTLIESYQAVATTVLNFSIQSPRYGLLKDRRDDGSFVVEL